MNIDDPDNSRDLAALMNTLHLSIDNQVKFIKEAGMAKDIKSLVKDINDGKISFTKQLLNIKIKCKLLIT